MDIPYMAEAISQKIKHFIITSSGHTAESASIEEFYQAFCWTFREEMMINWSATLDTIQAKKARILYFLSMEYLPGRLLANSANNLSAMELVRAVLHKLNRNFDDLISCETDPGLGNGGLGRLSSCFLDSLAAQQYPALAYGLRYQYGIFEQELWNGVQVERPDCWLLNNDPWEVRRDNHAATVRYRGHPIHAKNRHGEEVYLIEEGEEVRALPFDTPIIGYAKDPNFSVLTLRLWSTKESPRNFQLQRYNAGLLDQAAENTSLTDVLYPNDNTELGKRIRLKQEFLLVSASLQDILRAHLRTYGDMTQIGDKVRIQINDTHPALVVAELMRHLTKNYDFSWKEAWEVCQTCCSYTNHTILSEALEEWNEHRMQELIPRQYQIIQKLNLQFCNQVRSRYPNDEERVRRLSIIENGQVKMAHLAIVGSHKVNGVARLHSEILKKSLFKEFYEMFPEKFLNVTNGVTQRRWLLSANPKLAEFISKRIGTKWVTSFQELSKLAPFASDPDSQKEFLQIKRENKEALLLFLGRENAVRDGKGKILSHSPILPAKALFDLHIKRLHEYKRQLLNALHLILLYHELLENPQAREVERLSIFAGKAAPGYEKAKQVIQLISAISRKFRKHPELSKKVAVAFVENYNVSKAEILIPAADLSEQISTAGWEASGTGNMKLAMNGALTIGTEDGANIEMRESVGDKWWPFRFGLSAEEAKGPHNPWDIYSKDGAIQRALNSLKDHTFSETPEEAASFNQLYESLLAGGDRYRLLADLRPYYEAQKKVEALYLTPSLWAETAIHNIAGMGPFSTDISIETYAKKIWGIERCPPDPEILKKVRDEYSEHDRCNIKAGG